MSFIPELRQVDVDAEKKQYIKEFPTSVYIQLYAKWADCSDSKERKLTILLYRSTVLLLSLWQGDEPYLREFATKWYADKEAPVELPLKLSHIMRQIPPDDFVQMVDDFADVLSKDYLEEMMKIVDEKIAPLSEEKQAALKNV